LKEKRVDLHIHTNISDGSWDVEKLLEVIKRKKINIFSITDHDDLKNVIKMSQQELPDDIKFLKGVEVSTTLDRKEFHLAAYNIDLENDQLKELLKKNRNIRKDFNKSIIKYFEKTNNLELMNEYYDYKHDNNRGGWKALNFLIDKRLVNDLEDFFIKISNMSEEMVFLHPEKAIKVIHQAGGFAFLAHPASYYNGELLTRDFLKEWVALGIDGIEAYSPYLNQLKDAQYYIDFCKENDLMYSTGSDCHGAFIKDRKVGKPEVYLKDINIDKLLK